MNFLFVLGFLKMSCTPKLRTKCRKKSELETFFESFNNWRLLKINYGRVSLASLRFCCITSTIFICFVELLFRIAGLNAKFMDP